MASTETLLEKGLAKQGASDAETTIVLNHREAVRFLIYNIHYPGRKNDLNARAADLKNVHALLSQHLMRHPSMCGSLRKGPVLIKDPPYMPPAVPEMIEREFLVVADKAQLIEDTYEQAVFLLVHLPYLQPFEDGNKRSARVGCNIPLLKGGVVPMYWLDVTQRDYIDGILGVYERKTSRDSQKVFVDGYLDTIAHSMNGLPESVCSMGTACTKRHVERLMALAPEIIYAFDGGEHLLC